MRASLPVQPLELGGDARADAAEALGLADRLAMIERSPPRGRAPSATTTIANRARRALAPGDHLGDRLQLEGDLGDEDGVRAGGDARVAARSSLRSGP